MEQRIKQLAEEISPQLIKIRRNFHMHPELSMKEYETAKLIAFILKEQDGIEVREGLAGGTGVVGILKGRKGEGKTVLLRADIDALPIQEETNFPFQSSNLGCMHACGHDAHITWLLGSAMLLSKLRDCFGGTIKFVFQPGEECGNGGNLMVNQEHILENPPVDAVFAAHAWPTVDAGKIGIATKYAFGCNGGIQIKIIGKGGHGSWPHQCVDPIAVANQVYTNIQQIVSRKINAVEPRVISIGSIHAGPIDKGNIIPDTCMMLGTVRATKYEIVLQMLEEIENILKYITQANGASYEFSYAMGKAVENNREMVDFCTTSAKTILGEKSVYLIDEPNLGGEDFWEYSSRVPGTYMFVGIDNEETRGKFGLHSPIFQLDESVLSKASAVFAKIAIDYLTKPL